MHAICPAHLILLDLICLITVNKRQNQLGIKKTQKCLWKTSVKNCPSDSPLQIQSIILGNNGEKHLGVSISRPNMGAVFLIKKSLYLR
jgi:hypothetical protein